MSLVDATSPNNCYITLTLLYIAFIGGFFKEMAKNLLFTIQWLSKQEYEKQLNQNNTLGGIHIVHMHREGGVYKAKCVRLRVGWRGVYWKKSAHFFVQLSATEFIVHRLQ